MLDLAQARWQNERRPCRLFQAHRDFALLITLFNSGMRIGEATRHLWTDVDFVNHTVRVCSEQKRKISWRVVPVPAELTSALLLYRHEGEAHVAAKHGRKTGVRCRIRRRFEVYPRRASARLHRLMQEVGIDGRRAHPHVWRHTYAVLAVQAGMPPKMLMRLLGHAMPTVTMV